MNKRKDDYTTVMPGNRHTIVLVVIAASLTGLACLLLWNDEGQQQLMRNTAALAALACAISLPVGTLLAFLLVRTDVPGRRAALVLMAAMLLLPLYLQASAWHAGFILAGGSVTSPLLTGLPAAAWIHAMASIPWVVLIVGVGIRYVEPELEEEALLVGSTLQVFLRVTAPRMIAAMGVAALWVLLSTASEMTVTDLYRVRTYAEVIYTGFALGDDLRSAWLTAAPGIAAGASLVVFTFVVASTAAPSLQTASRPPWTFRLGNWRWPAFLFALAVVIGTVAIPIGNLVYKAGETLRPVDGVIVSQWSAAKFIEVLSPILSDHGEEFGWTVLISSLAATVALVLSAPLAWLARRGGRRSVPALATATVCLVTPGPLVGLGVIWLLDRNLPLAIWLYDRTVLAPVLAMLVRILPIAILLCWYALRSVSDDVLDSAATEGAGPCRRFWLIAAPQRLSAIGAAWLAAFVVATGDLACSILVVPPGVTTVPIKVFGLIHYGVDDQVAGICLTSLVGFVITAGTAIWLFRRSPLQQNTRHSLY